MIAPEKRFPVGTRVRVRRGAADYGFTPSSGVVVERFHDPEQARVVWGAGEKHTHNVSDLEHAQ